eukprot:1160187-Pelagomonas_calceolata.AAC.7
MSTPGNHPCRETAKLTKISSDSLSSACRKQNKTKPWNFQLTGRVNCEAFPEQLTSPESITCSHSGDGRRQKGGYLMSPKSLIGEG